MNRKPGDWNCSSCQHLNFSRRDSCQRCGDMRPGGSRGDERGDYGSFSRGGGSYGYGSGGGGGGGGGSGGGFSYGGGSDVRPGDWYCSSGGCGAHNFASRSSCFKCGAYKEESGSGGSGYETSGGRGSRGFASFNSGSGARSGWKSGDWICGRQTGVLCTGQDVMSITSPVGWNASGAVLQESRELNGNREAVAEIEAVQEAFKRR